MPDYLSMFTPCGMLELTSKPSHAEVIYTQIVGSLAKSFDMSAGTRMEGWAYGVAMALGRAQYALDRGGNQAHPMTAYDLIPLLEQGYLVVPAINDTVPNRAATLAAIDALSGGGRINDLISGLRSLLGAKFLAIVTAPKLTGTTPTVYPSNPSTGQGNWVPQSKPMRWLQLIDPVATIGSAWCAYQSLDTSQIPTDSWQASSTYSAGATLVPTSLNSTGYVYQCTTAGTSGTTEPTWPTTTGLTVTDGTATWSCAATTSPMLQVGETVTVQGENTAQAEAVTVTGSSVSVNPSMAGVTPGLVFQATFTKSHDIGASICTGPFPYWWSTQQQHLVVLTLAASADRETRRKVDEFMRKATQGTDTWAIIGARTTTLSGGTVGVVNAGEPMGCQPLASETFQNS